MARLRVGVQIGQQHADYATIREAAQRAEEMGVDIVYNWDHFFPLSGEPDGLHFECWTMLASWAEVTERVEIGPLVNCNSYRNPNLLADMARTVDHISNGRVILGMGSGWFARDYHDYGYEFGTAPSRLRDLDKAMPVIKDRLAKLNPPPIRRMPILIGGGGEKVTLRIAAQHADIWHGFGDPEKMAHKNRVLNDWCAKVGRNPAEIERSTDVAGPPTASYTRGLLAAGVSQFVIPIRGPHYDLSLARQWIDWRNAQS